MDRVLKQLPSTTTAKSRFVIPELRVFIEGKTTIFDNFDAVCGYINREAEHVIKFLLNELGTAGKVEGNRVIFQGQFSKGDVERQLM